MKFDVFKVNGMTLADRQDAPPKAALASVLEKFPEASARIRELFQQSSSFQSLCEDYRDCLAACQYWRQAASEDAPALYQSYAELLQELEQEVRQYLEQEQAPGQSREKGRRQIVPEDGSDRKARKRLSSTLRLEQRHHNHGGSMKIG